MFYTITNKGFVDFSPYQPEVVENAESGDREPLLRDSPAVRQNYETVS